MIRSAIRLAPNVLLGIVLPIVAVQTSLKAADSTGKQVIDLLANWEIREMEPTRKLDPAALDAIGKKEPGGGEARPWYGARMPAQVHDILLEHGAIEDPVKALTAKNCQWVSDRDWLYRCEFACPDPESKAFLRFLGLDTLVDIYLNGQHLAYHDDMFLPLRVEVTGKLREQNVLVLHFQSPFRFLNEYESAETAELDRWVAKHAVMGRSKLKARVLRKDWHDFDRYNGPDPYLCKVGVFDSVLLEMVDVAELTHVDVNYELSDDFTQAELRLRVEGAVAAESLELEIEVRDPDGRVVGGRRVAVDAREDAWARDADLQIEDVRLWWPVGYGDQPLYRVVTRLLAKGEQKDRIEKTIGFREMKLVDAGRFEFLINNTPVRFWGGNFAQPRAFTHCWDSQRGRRTLELALHANYNTLRIWGGGEPYGEDLYEEADRRGMLIWFEFYHTGGVFPVRDGFSLKYIREAVHHVKKLKHHPSIFMWCGGNEGHMHFELDHPYEKPECRFLPPDDEELRAIKAETGIEIDPEETRGRKFIGEEIFTVYYRKVVEAYDPQRFYHPNSPYGGERANDPHVGDVHPWSFYHTDMDYPVLSSEGVVGGTPPLKSLRKWLGDDLWPKEGWVCMKRNAREQPLPPSWRRIANDYYFFTRSRGMFDADTPESLAYMLDTAIALPAKETIERFRRGRPSTQPDGGRKCSGILVWRLNASWPQIAWNNIDYELEPNATYYYTRRAFEPFLLSFDTTNGIYLWAVNDTPRYVEGKVVFKLFHPGGNTAPIEIEKNVVVPAGHSRIVMDLSHLNQISRQHVLYACMTDRAGNVLTRQHEYLASEQRRSFPAARLRMEQRGDDLVITTDRYARSVELTGDAAGDEFGWLFEDNYFDLLPGETKTVKVLGRHRTGTIRAKPYYSPHVTTVEYDK